MVKKIFGVLLIVFGLMLSLFSIYYLGKFHGVAQEELRMSKEYQFKTMMGSNYKTAEEKANTFVSSIIFVFFVMGVGSTYGGYVMYKKGNRKVVVSSKRELEAVE